MTITIYNIKKSFYAFLCHKKNKGPFIILVIMGVYFLQHLISFRLGMNFEESRDANAYLLALEGYLPYRDFDWIYGPFAFLVYPFIFKVFGINLLILRISYIVIISFVIPITYLLARKIMSHYWAGIAAFLSIVFFDVPYYTYNHAFAVLGQLCCLLMLSRLIDIKNKVFVTFWAGIFTCITLLTKPYVLGVVLFSLVTLFLIFFSELGSFRSRLKLYIIFFITVGSLISICLMYFYFQTKLKGIVVMYPFFGQDSTSVSTLSQRVSLSAFIKLFLERLTGILPMHQIKNTVSLTDFKRFFVTSFDNFIFCLPFIVFILILIIFLAAKLSMVKTEIKKRIYADKKFWLLFGYFSIFISFDGLIALHRYSRAYALQVPFILSIYLFFLLKTFYSKRLVFISVFITVCYISFLHFFRYPYSMFKKYTQPMNLERARGVLVTYDEKRLYESLSSYLSINLNKGDKMVVIGYYPQFAFLTKFKNIFWDEEYILTKLEILSLRSQKIPEVKWALSLLEDKIISKIQKEKPKVLLVVPDNSSTGYKFISKPVGNFIEQNYSLDRTFGPADVFGMDGRISYVELYKYKEKQGS